MLVHSHLRAAVTVEFGFEVGVRCIGDVKKYHMLLKKACFVCRF